MLPTTSDRSDLPAVAGITNDGIRAFLRTWLDGRSRHTTRAYRLDLTEFSSFLGCSELDAVRALLASNNGAANTIVLRFRHHQQERGLAAATVSRRLTTVRSMVRLARVLGMVSWSLDVGGAKGDRYRDTRGPGADGFAAMLRSAAAQSNASKAARDAALLWCLFAPALRRGEVAALDLEHLDLPGSRVSVLGKGRADREWVTLPDETTKALRAWIAARGEAPGPLFVNLSRAHARQRITGDGIARVTKRLGRSAGVGDVRPHGLRHGGITTALDATNGDVRAVARFSRHRDVRVLQRYDDNRADLGGAVSRVVAAAVGVA